MVDSRPPVSLQEGTKPGPCLSPQEWPKLTPPSPAPGRGQAHTPLLLPQEGAKPTPPLQVQEGGSPYLLSRCKRGVRTRPPPPFLSGRGPSSFLVSRPGREPSPHVLSCSSMGSSPRLLYRSSMGTRPRLLPRFGRGLVLPLISSSWRKSSPSFPSRYKRGQGHDSSTAPGRG